MGSTIMGVALIVIAALCLVVSWRSLSTETRRLAALGKLYRMERWKGESAWHYQDRIRARSVLEDQHTERLKTWRR